MTGDSLGQVLQLLLQWTFYLVALATAVTVYRLTALNSFVDHRKSDLQHHLADEIRKYPGLLTAIHHLGKIGALRSAEQRLFELLPGGFYAVVRQIYRLRAAYNWLVALLVFLLVFVCTLVVQVIFHVYKTSEFSTWLLLYFGGVFLFSVLLIALGAGLGIPGSGLRTSHAVLLQKVIAEIENARNPDDSD